MNTLKNISGKREPLSHLKMMNTKKLVHFIMLFSFILLSTNLPAQNETGVKNITISENAAARIDTIVAEAYNLNPVDFNTILTAYTFAGNRWDIKMAVLTMNDTVSGGDLSGYAWVQETTEAGRVVLTDSLPNTCFSVFDLNDFQEDAAYQQAVSNHWDS